MDEAVRGASLLCSRAKGELRVSCQRIDARHRRPIGSASGRGVCLPLEELPAAGEKRGRLFFPGKQIESDTEASYCCGPIVLIAALVFCSRAAAFSRPSVSVSLPVEWPPEREAALFSQRANYRSAALDSRARAPLARLQSSGQFSRAENSHNNNSGERLPGWIACPTTTGPGCPCGRAASTCSIPAGRSSSSPTGYL